MPGFILASVSTAVIVLLALLAIGLVALLAWAMSRPARLRPHRPGVTGNRWGLRRRRWQEHAAQRTAEAGDDVGSSGAPQD